MYPDTGLVESRSSERRLVVTCMVIYKHFTPNGVKTQLC
jgi:hypothetical protein